jgi:hypothetical protein
MRDIRGHLSFANVVSVVALFVALGGTAIASVIITSNSQVTRNTISGHHPPSGKHPNVIGGSINGRDIADASLTGADLAPSAMPRGKTRIRPQCNPASSSYFIRCGRVTINLARPSRVLVVVTGNWNVEPRPAPIGSKAEGECELTRDYAERGGGAFNGSTAPPTGFNGGSLALSVVVGPLTGRHTVGVQCRELAGDIFYSGITVSAVALSPAWRTIPTPMGK